MASQAPSQAPPNRSSPTAQTPFPAAHEASTREMDTSNSEVEHDIVSPTNVPQPAADPTVTESTLQPAPPQPLQQPTPQHSTESRSCWVCLQGDADDDSRNREWKNPCPCSLTAHHSCLLDFIAATEASTTTDLVANTTISCPQCKTSWNIQRPQDPVLKAYGAIQKATDTLILPVIASTSLGFLYSGFLMYGLNSISMVFGRDEAVALLGARIRLGRSDNSTWSLISRSLHWTEPFLPTNLWAYNYKLLLSLPLIGPSLILLRTRFADQASAVILPLYFLKHQKTHPNFNLTWPPSPGLTFATLPFIKKAYNALYASLFSSLEKEWDLAVQRKPREGETAEEIREIQNGMPEVGGELVINLEWEREEVEVVVAEGEPDLPPADGDVGAAIAIGEGEAGQNGEAADADLNGNPNGVANRNQGPMRHVDNFALNQNIPTAHIISTVLGALVFPTISSVMGDLLKFALPTKWTSGFGYGGGALLGKKWGRSVLGGCLFVVLKDAVTLYCKWRKAKDFGKRKVLDWTGERRAGK